MMNIDSRYELAKRREKIQLWIVWHLPKWVIYWATIRLVAFATTKPKVTSCELKMMDALKMWEEQ